MSVEAFCLMIYQCEKCCIREVLWNTRDGVTPFCIGCASCDGMAQHVDWEKDERKPAHVPADDQRVFVDLTEERMREINAKQIERYWDHETVPMKEMYETKDKAMSALMESWDPEAGEPDIITGAEFKYHGISSRAAIITFGLSQLRNSGNPRTAHDMEKAINDSNAAVVDKLTEACHRLDNMWGHHQDGSDLLVKPEELFHIVQNDVLRDLLRVAVISLTGEADNRCLDCGIPKPTGCQCERNTPREDTR